MSRVVYIGLKEQKADNVAGTRLVWIRGQVHEVEDELKAAILLKHPLIWADADKEYALTQLPKAVEPAPRVSVIPVDSVSPYWEPVVIQVTEDVFKRLMAKELCAIFVTEKEADAFADYRLQSSMVPVVTAAEPEVEKPDVSPQETGPVAEKRVAESKSKKEEREARMKKQEAEFQAALESATKKVA
jgi:hypothetical protein